MPVTTALLWIGGILLLFALPVGYFTYLIHSPHLLLNETTGRLYQYREVDRRDGAVALIPGFFAGGEHKQDVERELVGAGLDRWHDFSPLPPGAASMQTFHFAAGLRNLACGNALFLEIYYDDDDRVQSATISQGGACL